MDVDNNIKLLAEQLRQHIKNSGFKVSQYRLDSYLNAAQGVIKVLNRSATNYLEFQIILNIVLSLMDSVKVETDTEDE